MYDLSHEILPMNTKIAIKEPYLHRFDSGEIGKIFFSFFFFLLFLPFLFPQSNFIGIRVDSPSDIIIDRSSCFSNCFECGEKWKKKGGGRKLKECKGCEVRAMYCGEECQKKDWEQHKLFHRIKNEKKNLF